MSVLKEHCCHITHFKKIITLSCSELKSTCLFTSFFFIKLVWKLRSSSPHPSSVLCFLSPVCIWDQWVLPVSKQEQRSPGHRAAALSASINVEGNNTAQLETWLGKIQIKGVLANNIRCSENEPSSLEEHNGIYHEDEVGMTWRYLKPDSLCLCFCSVQFSSVQFNFI